jgi:hypothetical protein
MPPAARRCSIWLPSSEDSSARWSRPKSGYSLHDDFTRTWRASRRIYSRTEKEPGFSGLFSRFRCSTVTFASAVDDNLSVMVPVTVPVVPSSVVVAITSNDNGAVRAIFPMVPCKVPVAVPMTIANPYVQFLSKRRGCNANGCKCRKNESNLAHFYTPGLLAPERNALTKLLFRRNWQATHVCGPMDLQSGCSGRAGGGRRCITRN